MKLPAIPVEGGEVQGTLYDQQGLFNLNNLVRNGTASAIDLVRFQRLLDSAGPAAGDRRRTGGLDGQQ